MVEANFPLTLLLVASPSRRYVTGHVERCVRQQRALPRRLHILPQDEAPRESDEQSDQEEQQPPAARTQGGEPQRSEQRHHGGLGEAPPDLPAVERPQAGGLADRLVPAVSDRWRDGEEDGYWQPGGDEPAEGHRRRRPGGPEP